MKKKLLFVSNHLKIGGIEKSLVNLLNVISDDYNIDLLLFTKEGDFLIEVPSSINIISANFRLQAFGLSHQESKKKGIITFGLRCIFAVISRVFNYSIAFKLATIFYKQKDNYDVAIAYAQNNNIHSLYAGASNFVVSKVNAKKKIAFIHDQISEDGSNSKIAQKIYEDFDKLIFVSKSCMEKYSNIHFNRNNAIDFLYNFQNSKNIIEKSFGNIDENLFNSNLNFVAVGRLDPLKNFISLVKVCHKLLKKYSFNCHIIGNGKCFKEIKSYIDLNNLNNNVIIYGAKSNPYPYIAKADALVICSLEEAAPMIIGESFILHTPVLSTNTLSAKELIPPNYGLICDNSYESLYEMLENILKNPKIIYQMKDELKNYTYDNKKMYNKIKEII